MPPAFSAATLTPRGVDLADATHRGRRAVHVVESQMGAPGVEPLAHLPGLFEDGEIECWLAADRRPDADPDMRGFAGLAFRVQEGSARFELLFVRPTNARADDQLRRNHTTQYASLPDWPWHRLRGESPGVYESYADMEPGAWTRLRVVVRGERAELFVGASSQPALLVKDLKMGHARGGVALWIGTGTDAYFADVVVRPRS